MDPQDALFDDAPPPELATPPGILPDAPLAERLRPTRLDEVIGQTHLLGPGMPLRVAFESGKQIGRAHV